ncbi:Panacea domain-containing protein, partial [Bacteroides stercoris]
MCKFSEDSRQKLGNAVIYIANHTEQLSKTKLLKLLFLMEEYMVKRYHVPFMGLPFEIWQAGPVAKDIFIDLSDGPFLLKDFVKTEVQKDATYIRAIKPFCDDEFSDCEMEMMDEIIRKYG